MKKGFFFSFRLLLVLSLTTVVFHVSAKGALFVYPADGGSAQSTALKNIQRLKFSESKLLLKKTDGSENAYPLAAIGKMTFEEDNINIPALQSKAEINLYPNPSTDYVTVDSSVDIVSLTLFGLNGKVLKSAVSASQIQVVDLPAGFYLLKIETVEGVVTKKIIKQ